MRSSRAAFTLLEMALVIAIIGLLMGGVVMGKNLLRNMQVKHVLDDAANYARVMYQFKDKYGQLPGDYNDATSVWGSSATYCSTASNGSPGTCNGDGDGNINGLAGGVSTTTEVYQFWNQLMLAGFIKGKFTGANGPGNANYDVIPGTNSPISAIKNATFWIYSWGEQASDSGTFYAGNYNNGMVYGGRVTNAWNHAPVLTGKEAYDLDKKADDGLPAFGNIRTLATTWVTANNAVTCATSDTGSAAVYTKTNTSPICFPIFLLNSFQAPARTQ